MMMIISINLKHFQNRDTKCFSKHKVKIVRYNFEKLTYKNLQHKIKFCKYDKNLSYIYIYITNYISQNSLACQAKETI